ncbi:MAG: hypothetical protein ACOYK9_03075 [Chlamydiia bacterium]
MPNSEETLFQLFQEGLLVTPKDSVETFERRVILYKELPEIDFKKRLFGIHTAHTHYSIKKMLLPWFAAITKFDHINDTPIPRIEISPQAVNEVLDHELVHAVRAPFEESIFEEFLAFETSSGWRRATGPIFFHAYEGNLVALLLVTSLFYLPLLFFALAFITYLIVRLIETRKLYKKALDAICSTFSTENPLPYALMFNEEETKILANEGGTHLMKNIEKTNPLRATQIHSLKRIQP